MAEKEKKVVEAENKPSNPEKKNKRKGWFRGFKSEIKKIVWPSWKQVLKNTGVVLVIILVFAVIIGALDFAFGSGIAGLTKLFS